MISFYVVGDCVVVVMISCDVVRDGVVVMIFCKLSGTVLLL